MACVSVPVPGLCCYVNLIIVSNYTCAFSAVKSKMFTVEKCLAITLSADNGTVHLVSIQQKCNSRICINSSLKCTLH